jgi:hypothetical protein
MLRSADITGHALEYRREKMREDSGVFLSGSRGQRGDSRRGLYGQIYRYFAGRNQATGIECLYA